MPARFTSYEAAAVAATAFRAKNPSARVRVTSNRIGLDGSQSTFRVEYRQDGAWWKPVEVGQ